MAAILILQRDAFRFGLPTLGVFFLREGAGETKLVKTLELPWNANKRGSSCIPAGSYDLRWTYSPRFKKHTWQVVNVPGRSGIRIHSGNRMQEIQGCILPGLTYADIDGDGVLDITNSRVALGRLQSRLAPYQATGIRCLVRNKA